MKTAPLAILLLAVAPGFALAQDTDMDSDATMTKEQVMTTYPEVTAEQFAQADVNGDGTLDAAELTAAREAGLIPAEK